MSAPATPVSLGALDANGIAAGAVVNSVAVRDGIVALASPNADEQQDGSVVFLNTDGDFLKQVVNVNIPGLMSQQHSRRRPPPSRSEAGFPSLPAPA